MQYGRDFVCPALCVPLEVAGTGAIYSLPSGNNIGSAVPGLEFLSCDPFYLRGGVSVPYGNCCICNLPAMFERHRA